MPWDRGAAVPAAQPASRSASVSASKPAAPAPQPAPTPTPQPVAAPAPATAPAPKPQSNNAAQVAAAGTAETPAVEDAGELQRKWAEVVERVKARQASYAGLLLNARATADDGSKLTVSFPAGSTFAIKMLGRADTQSVVLPTVSAVFGRRTVDYVLDGVARRLLNMRSILHLHGLRYLRTRNPCPRRPLYPRVPARHSSKRRR